jgi:hypothetical protein
MLVAKSINILVFWYAIIPFGNPAWFSSTGAARLNRFSTEASSGLNPEQGDQIGRNFAYWLIVYFGHFLRNSKVCQTFWLFFPRNKFCINFDKKCFGLHFGRFFSKTHPVTLTRSASERRLAGSFGLCARRQVFLLQKAGAVFCEKVDLPMLAGANPTTFEFTATTPAL